MRNHRPFLFALLLGAVSLNAQAVFITIDGNPADWGLKRNGNASDWNPDPLLNLSPNQFTIEDQTGGANTRLMPGWGGQAYDAEALYAYLNGQYLYLLLATGLDPNTPNNPAANSYGPGDFAIDFIDFGPPGSFEFGIETTGKDAGKVYRNVAWAYGLWDAGNNFNPSHPDPLHPTSILSGELAGLGTLVYTSTPVTNMGAYKNDKHYFIEAAIPLSTFNGYSGKFDVHWSMNCANDAISANSALSVPEPGTLALLPLGLVGLTFLHRRRRA